VSRLIIVVVLAIAFIAIQPITAQSVTPVANPSPSPASKPNSSSGPDASVSLAPEVVVSASRVKEDAKAAVGQITVIDSKQIAESGAASVVSVLEKVAGLNITSYSGDAEAQVSMHGFGDNGFGRVLVLVDGQKLNNPDMQGLDWLSVPLGDIDRIEVLHGSASSRYGNGAVGGVINIITKKAIEKPGFQAGLLVGSNWTHREDASASFKAGKIGLRISSEDYGTNGHRDRSAFKSSHATVKGFIPFSDSLDVTLSTGLSDIYNQFPGGLTKAEYDNDPKKAFYTAYPAPTYVATEMSNDGDEAHEYRIDNNLGIDWVPSDVFSLSVPVHYTYKRATYDLPSYPSYYDKDQHGASVSPLAEINLGNKALAYRFTGGLDLSYDEISRDAFSNKARTLGYEQNWVGQTTVGPHSEARIDIQDVFGLEVGARYDIAWLKALKGDKHHGAFVWDGGVNVRPIKELRFWTKYGTLFRYPFTDEQFAVSSSSSTTSWDVKPETGYNAQFGVGFEINKFLALESSVYLLEMQDEIAWDTTLGNVNLDKTRRIGVDASLDVTPLSEITITTSYGFVDARFTEGTNQDKLIPLVPAHNFSGGVRFNLPSGLSFGPDVSVHSDSVQSSDNANALPNIPSYALLGGKLRYELKNLPGSLSIAITGKNLLDLKYATFATYNTWYPAPGRSVEVSIDYRY